MELRIKVLLLVFVVGVFGTVHKAFSVEQTESGQGTTVTIEFPLLTPSTDTGAL